MRTPTATAAGRITLASPEMTLSLTSPGSKLLTHHMAIMTRPSRAYSSRIQLPMDMGDPSLNLVNRCQARSCSPRSTTSSSEPSSTRGTPRKVAILGNCGYLPRVMLLIRNAEKYAPPAIPAIHR